MLLLDRREIVRFKVLFGQLDLRHQLVGDDLQHFFQFSQVIGAEALFSALHDQVQVGIADVVVINVLLGWARLKLFDAAKIRQNSIGCCD